MKTDICYYTTNKEAFEALPYPLNEGGKHRWKKAFFGETGELETSIGADITITWYEE